MIDIADAKHALPGPTVRFPGVPAIVDGSEAIAHVEEDLRGGMRLPVRSAADRADLTRQEARAPLCKIASIDTPTPMAATTAAATKNAVRSGATHSEK